MKHFLYYWKAQEIEGNRKFPNEPLEHVGSNQLERADVGDEIFFIGWENGSMLLLGKLIIGQIVGLEEARELMENENLIDTDLHAISPPPREDETYEVYLPCLIPVGDLWRELDIINGTKEVEQIGLPIHPNRFQTMRQLTPDSAERLSEYYHSEFDGPNDLLERDDEEE